MPVVEDGDSDSQVCVRGLRVIVCAFARARARAWCVVQGVRQGGPCSGALVNDWMPRCELLFGIYAGRQLTARPPLSTLRQTSMAQVAEATTSPAPSPRAGVDVFSPTGPKDAPLKPQPAAGSNDTVNAASSDVSAQVGSTACGASCAFGLCTRHYDALSSRRLLVWPQTSMCSVATA